MSKAKRILQWEPKVRFEELVGMMVDADLKDIQERGDRPQRSREH
jgi:GDP-D-mannose dehydratase